MKDNSVKALAALGQSIWLDYIRRNLIVSGELRRLIKQDGLGDDLESIHLRKGDRGEP